MRPSIHAEESTGWVAAPWPLWRAIRSSRAFLIGPWANPDLVPSKPNRTVSLISRQTCGNQQMRHKILVPEGSLATALKILRCNFLPRGIAAHYLPPQCWVTVAQCLRGYDEARRPKAENTR